MQKNIEQNAVGPGPGPHADQRLEDKSSELGQENAEEKLAGRIVYICAVDTISRPTSLILSHIKQKLYQGLEITLEFQRTCRVQDPRGVHFQMVDPGSRTQRWTEEALAGNQRSRAFCPGFLLLLRPSQLPLF